VNKQKGPLADQSGVINGRRPGLVEFERLYERDFHAFVRVARAIVGDAQLAVDAVHDGLTAAIRGRDGYRGDGPFEAWVWRAVVNAARKGRAAKADFLPLLSVDDLGSTEENPDEFRLTPVLLALPDRQRLIVFLRYYADLDYRAISAALGIEVGTVSAALNAAHRSLRNALQEVETNG
jgi:RNA polymerase sigma factor (sigma-70 family)